MPAAKIQPPAKGTACANAHSGAIAKTPPRIAQQPVWAQIDVMKICRMLNQRPSVGVTTNCSILHQNGSYTISP